MNRTTLPELRDYVERCRVAAELVQLDPVTARSLVDATEALLAAGERLGELPVTVEPVEGGVRLAAAETVPRRVVDDLVSSCMVARARFVDPFVEPSTPSAELPAAGPSDRLRLDAELAELRARLRAVLPAWRRSWRRRRSS